LLATYFVVHKLVKLLNILSLELKSTTNNSVDTCLGLALDNKIFSSSFSYDSWVCFIVMDVSSNFSPNIFKDMSRSCKVDSQNHDLPKQCL
jgi:hypothetical protein